MKAGESVKHYLGIDGGGTKTTAVVADEKGKILFRAQGKSINFYGVGMEKARENLAVIITKIQEKTGIEDFYSAFIGCSALDTEADKKTIDALCGGIINAEKIGMNSDVFVALKAASGNSVAICGTGSMAIGEAKDGSVIIKGGWGHILGDEGSGYSIAVSALKKCCICYDKGIKTPLVDEAIKFFGIKNFREIIDIIYSPETAKDSIAGFAGIVGSLAQEDKACKKIIEAEAAAFAHTVISLISQLGKGAHLSLYGGVFNNSLFREIFCNKVKESYPETIIDSLTTPAEEGALKASMELK